ncbi:hypothetical protein [Frankia sp. QA3]|uniref:hypothetical protein n=1 Tax=Frankia sp. QA3 TaxID=710111 RepID=UPI000269C673|nr:hypothetical protein [Frankia sp. QA3]EIV94006.1 hypothetical protein FraQA3DRAFT_3736 [Frankia sp. QA3]
MPDHRPASFGPYPAGAGTNGFPPPAAPGRDDAFPLPAAPAPDGGRIPSLPGLLPGLPPQGTEGSAPPTGDVWEGARRPAADRHKVLVDRRLLAGGGGLLLVLVLVFGILAFTGGSDGSGEPVAVEAPARPAGAGTAAAARARRAGPAATRGRSCDRCSIPPS